LGRPGEADGWQPLTTDSRIADRGQVYPAERKVADSEAQAFSERDADRSPWFATDKTHNFECEADASFAKATRSECHLLDEQGFIGLEFFTQ